MKSKKNDFTLYDFSGYFVDRKLFSYWYDNHLFSCWYDKYLLLKSFYYKLFNKIYSRFLNAKVK